MNEDTNVNTQMSHDTDTMQDSEAMKKELGEEGIEIESSASVPSSDSIDYEEDEEEEEEEFPTNGVTE